MPFKLTSRIGIAVGLALGTSFVCAPLLGKVPGQAASPAQQDDPALVARARGIHERVITADTHAGLQPGPETDNSLPAAASTPWRRRVATT